MISTVLPPDFEPAISERAVSAATPHVLFSRPRRLKCLSAIQWDTGRRWDWLGVYNIISGRLLVTFGR